MHPPSKSLVAKMTSLFAAKPVCFVFLICTLSLTCVQSNAGFDFTFDSDLEGMASHRGGWRWSDRENLPWAVPPGGEGFAVHDAAGQGDDLYAKHVSLEHGLSYSIKYFVNSKFEGGITFALHKLSEDGKFLEVIQEFPYNPSLPKQEWLSATGYVTPEEDAVVSLFCQQTAGNLNREDYLEGCAVDQVVFTRSLDLDDVAAAATTESAIITTSEAPSYVVEFNFENSTEGWTLGRSNGASWRRVGVSNAAVAPAQNSHMLFLFANDVVSGTVLATSPRLVAGPTGQVSLSINFLLRGSQEYPAFLKIRRAYSYLSYDDNPALSLDGFGSQENQNWFNYGGTYQVNPGEEFFLVLEGTLGIDNLNNQVGVTAIKLDGVLVSPVPEADFFDFGNGLPGWTNGNTDGGMWQVQRYSDLDTTSYGIPVPAAGTDAILLWAQRFDIHSGVLGLESPPIEVITGTTRHININFWVSGSQSYPTSLRIRLKSIDGVYDYLPFLDLSSYGSVHYQDWINLNNFYEIPTDGIDGYFQLVLEVDLGSSATNAVAISSIEISTQDVAL